MILNAELLTMDIFSGSFTIIDLTFSYSSLVHMYQEQTCPYIRLRLRLRNSYIQQLKYIMI